MAEKSKKGRKCLYDELVKPRLEWIKEQVRNGITEKAIAEELGITEQTLANYKNKFPEFKEVISKDKGADVLKRLVNSGIESACGQWIEEETTTIILDEKTGEPIKRQKIITKKYLPPNASLNQYYTKVYGKDEGFTGDPLALAFKQAKLDFDKAVQSAKDWTDYK